MNQGFAGLDNLRDALHAISSLSGSSNSVTADSPTPQHLVSQKGPAQVDLGGDHFNEHQEEGNPVDAIIQVRASLLRSTTCPVHCPCQCHTASRLRSPGWLCKAFGRLFIGYSAIPILNRKPCNEKSCRKQSQPRLIVTYFFPLWLLKRVMSIRATFSLEEPIGSSWVTKIPRVVPGDAAIAVKAFQTDVTAVQTLFSQGKASPFDVQAHFGNSPLHVGCPNSCCRYLTLTPSKYAVTYQSFELCKLLMNNGADPFMCDNYF